MDTATAIHKMQDAGFRLAVNEGRLLVDPGDRLNEAQCQFLRDHKAEIIAALAANDPHQAANDHTAEPILVQAWTPNGDMAWTTARDEAHAAWIRRMNPPPDSRLARPGDLCAVGVDSGAATGWWASTRHVCGQFTEVSK
jgi:hypothetical protein